MSTQYSAVFIIICCRSVIEKAENVLSSKRMHGAVQSTVVAPSRQDSTGSKSGRRVVIEHDDQRTVTTKGKSHVQVTISSADDSKSRKDPAGTYVKDLRDKLTAGIRISSSDSSSRKTSSSRDIWSTRGESRSDRDRDRDRDRERDRERHRDRDRENKDRDRSSGDSRRVVEESKSRKDYDRKLSIADESKFVPDYDESEASDSDSSRKKHKHKHKKHKKEKKAKKEKKEKKDKEKKEKDKDKK